MSVLGRITAAVVGRGGKLLGRGAEGAVKRVPRDVAKRTITRVRPETYISPRRGPATPGRPGTRFNSVGESSVPGPLGPDMAGRRILPSPTPGGSFGKGGTPAKGAMPGVKKDISTPTSKSASGGVLRRASVVGRRYFTQGTAGSGLNMKRAIPAAVAAAVPVSIVSGKAAVAIKRKLEANAQETPRGQRSAETASQANPTSSSIAAADLSSSGSTSSSDSTSTSQSPVSRTNSTTGIGGALQGEMRASAKAVRPDRDYMGESFDASLRKGVDTGRKYLKQQLASDKVDSKRQRTLLDQYDRRIGKDTLLGRDRGVGYVSKADTDQTQKDLLSAYRGRFGSYRKNATAGEIEAMAKAAAAKRGS